MAGGRPTKLCDDHIKYIDEYINECGDEWEQLEKSSSSGEKSSSESYENKLLVNLPTYAGLILFWREKNKDLKVNKTTLIDWKKKGEEENAEEIYVEFSNSLDNLLLLQEKMLINGGISAKYSGVIAKLMLSSNHGYKETNVEEIKHSGSIGVEDLKGLSTEELLARKAEREKKLKKDGLDKEKE